MEVMENGNVHVIVGDIGIITVELQIKMYVYINHYIIYIYIKH